MSRRDQVMRMLFNLADPALRELPEVTGQDATQLRDLWQKKWDSACAESGGDLVELADAVCEELKMLILVTIMEHERC